ncbi:MAG: NAD(P)H-dependent oxidoreductase subunit E [Bryobacteraceae bacterium]|nr:NAD(P)H-dependent oxidoreductase subunit E [Bryobacteraceae bacterium]
MPATQTQTKSAAGAPPKDNRERMLERAMSRHNYSGDALIEVLHTAQELYGHLTPELLATIARKLKLPPSRVLGVTTFYHFFSLAPKGEHTFIVCTGTACYVKGAQALLDKLTHRCQCKPGGTSPDGKVSVAGARCIGSCGLAPAVIYDGNILARVTPEQLDAELDRIGVQ